MKRSKVFLGATAALLAVVGFISAKAHRHFSTITFYSLRVKAGENFCTQLVTKAGTVGATASPIGFTQYSSNPCTGKTVKAE